MKEKNYKEKVLTEIIVAVCTWLNSNGGKVMIQFDTDSSISVEGSPFSKVSFVICILEQSMISIIEIHQTITKVNFRGDGNSVIIFVKKADSIVTSISDLYGALREIPYTRFCPYRNITHFKFKTSFLPTSSAHLCIIYT